MQRKKEDKFIGSTSNFRLIDFCKETALLTGDILMKYFAKNRSELKETLKSPRNVLTKADLEAETFIRERISKYYPDDEIVGEEFSVKAGIGNKWYIDPLDGTTNFAAGIPHWAVSIGVYDGKGEAAAVIYSPLREELFYAERGKGAFLNGKRIKVSKIDKLNNALAATGFASMRGDDPDIECIKRFTKILIQVKGIRRLGSAALDAAYTACGRFDLFFEEGLGKWDVAAGALIVKEAGGIAVDYEGHSEYLQRGSIITGNKKIVDKVLKLIRSRK